MSAAREAVSASCSAPASRYRPGSWSRRALSSDSSQALERETPVRSRIEALSGEILRQTAASALKYAQRIEAEALPADVLDEIASAYCGRSWRRWRRPAMPSCRALVGDNRGCDGCQFRGAAGYLPVGDRSGANSCSGSEAAGQVCIRWSRSPTAAGVACRKMLSQWRWSCRRWWMPEPPV